MDKAHESGKRLFAPQGDPAEALELVEEELDLMAFLVQAPVDRRRLCAAGVGLDLRGGAKVVCDEGAQRIGVVGGIGDDVTDASQAGQESLGLRTVAMLPRRWMNADGQADRINGRVQLGCQPAARTANRGSLSPPFAPVASAWTFARVLSIKTYSKSGVSASAWNSLAQTPACDQRRNRA